VRKHLVVVLLATVVIFGWTGSPAHAGDPQPEVQQYMEDASKADITFSQTLCRPADGDRDHDGLGDACDPAPATADADADGFPDSVETLVGTDPLRSCPTNEIRQTWPFDINGDGRVTTADILRFRGNLGGNNRRFDLNADGKVNIADVLLFSNVIGKSCPARTAGDMLTAASAVSYAPAATTYSLSCYSEYVGKSTAKLPLYKLWVTTRIYYQPFGSVTGFTDPPYHGAVTYVAGWSYSGLSADAYWYSRNREVQGYAKANFAFKAFGITWSQQTRWAVASAWYSNGVGGCGKQAW